MTQRHDSVTTTCLRDLVAQRLDKHWSDFAQAHPHLAEAIDRTQLIDLTIDKLEEDADFVAAMRQANIDHAALTTAVRLVDKAESWIRRLLA